MNIHKRYVVGLMAAALLMVPVISSADTISDLQAQIQTLLTQVRALQDQIRSVQMGTTTLTFATSTIMRMGDDGQGDGQGQRMCPPMMITRNLGPGSRGDDVKGVQLMLAADPAIYNGTTTGFFGSQTAQAVARFQMKFGIASTSTGVVGQMTREFFNKKCLQPMPPQGGMMATSTNAMWFRPSGDDHNQGWMTGTTTFRMMGTTTRMMPPPPFGEGKGEQGRMMGGQGDR